LHSEQSNRPFNQTQAQNQPNFKILGKISEKEKIESIERGFPLIGYRIKYESIQRTKFYQNFKK